MTTTMATVPIKIQNVTLLVIERQVVIDEKFYMKRGPVLQKHHYKVLQKSEN